MSANMFDILMVIALGTLTGTGIGLLIGFFAVGRKSEWSAMSRKEQRLNVILVIAFCLMCTAIIGYYSLVKP